MEEVWVASFTGNIGSVLAKAPRDPTSGDNKPGRSSSFFNQTKKLDWGEVLFSGSENENTWKGLFQTGTPWTTRDKLRQIETI